MAKKKPNGKKPARRAVSPTVAEEEHRPWHADLNPDAKKSVLVVLLFLVTALLVLSFIGKGGSAGGLIYNGINFLLGKGYFFAPVTLILIASSLIFAGERRLIGVTFFGGILFLLVSLTGFHVLFGAGTGGFLGSLAGSLLLSLFDVWASGIIVVALFLISIILMLNIPLFTNWMKSEEGDEDEEEEKAEEMAETAMPLPPTSGDMGMKAMLENINATIQSALQKKPEESASTPAPAAEKQDDSVLALRKVTKRIAYERPPLELLQGDRGKPNSGDIRANANIIKRTLENFGIMVEMGEVSIGPTVTQYTLRPAEGVKLARIIALHNDLSLALAAHPIRIEAPIPGKSLVGIEVPNKSIALVGIRVLFEQPAFRDAVQPLMLALGRDVTGAPVYGDLARMPHLLISGATGSGKSVAAHAVIMSLIYRNPPEMLRFILVDPKRVELSVYNDIPHLLTPVITDPKTTIQALRWATKEMDRRYDLLSIHQSRDITSFNTKMAKETGAEAELLPYIVIMIDELADLMSMFPREVEASIIRLSQMARAVGIHLIVATQRPSVEVITGLIKANITSRMAFQVASQIDSRTILDMAGAEKLLGSGDMLFLAGDTGKPRRIQGGYVAEQEVKRVVDFLREESEAPEYNEAILQTKLEDEGSRNGVDGLDDGDDDPLYEDAKALVIDAGKASASYLQRRLRVGYARAARLLDLLEGNGVIGPGDGAKPREVLIKTADYVGDNEFE